MSYVKNMIDKRYALSIISLLITLTLLFLSSNAFAQVSKTEAFEIVVSEALDGNTEGKRIYVTQEIVPAGTVIKCGRYTLTLPSRNGWLFFIDDHPWANWAHPCRYVFVDSETQNFTVYHAKMPPDNIGKFELLIDVEIPANEEHSASNILDFRNIGTTNQAACAHPENCYAVIISGGINYYNNWIRYWNDCSAIYTTLTQVYGYRDDHIYVLMSDGTDPGDDRHRYDGTYDSSPLDLDGDGDDDIDYSATQANITTVFNTLRDTLDWEDSLFIYTTDHGGQTAGQDVYMCLWGEEIDDGVFAAEVNKVTCGNIMVVMEQCHSGGFVDDLSACGRTIATACSHDEGSWAMPPDYLYDEFVYYWTAAVRGQFPDGTPVDADTNDDGFVSMREAFDYAYANDGWVTGRWHGTPQEFDQEHPQYNSTSSKIGENLDLCGIIASPEIHKALVWLCRQKNENGSWSDNVGLTSLATLAFLNSGHDETDPAVENAIDYITSNVKGDGSIWSLGYKTYETSLAVLPLVATYNGAYTDTVENAADWLKDSQWGGESCLWGTVNRDNWYYGGFGYGSHGRPDLSNTQFALMALDSVISVPKDDELWDKAQIFLARTQMRQQDVYIPDLDYTVEWNLSYNKYDDGGFVYYPGVSLSWTGTSYGSMTAAGIWSLRLCDVPPDNPRVQTALNWLLDNYTWDSNPGMTPDGRRFQYYYYLALSKALTMALESDEFNGHDWYGDMSTKLIDLQHSDGHWVNSYIGHGGEDDPTLCTAYSILSLQVREIPTNIQRLSWMTFILRSNADLHVYDPLGRHVGMNYETGQIEIEIPDATFVMNNTQEITVPRLEEGKYIIELVGTGTGEYELTVTAGVGDTVVADETIAGFITEGEVHEAIATVAMIVGLTIDIMAVDNTPPEIEIEVPQPNQALQDGVTFTASASDQSGVASLAFYVREPNDGNGIPIGYECLAATLNGATGKWEHAFDTTQLPDGNYVILAKAADNKDNEGWSEIVPFSIRNWAVIELLPNTANNKAGRTMPVKFALRIAAAVDPAQPFVYNQELEIRIYDVSAPNTILQTSLYGDTSKDYRIDTAGELYITNFKTSKTPAEYEVEIWRMSKNFLVGSFTFETVK